MSSISPQAVVERASAEISKRINGLGLRTKHHHGNSVPVCATSASSSASTVTSSTVPAAAAAETAAAVSKTTAHGTTASGTITTNCSKSSSVMERVTHVLCGGNFNQTASNNQAKKNHINNMNVLVIADKQTRNNTGTPSIPTCPTNIPIGNTTTTGSGNRNYQLQTQIAGSTLVQSNLAPTPTALGLTSIGAPPTPTVTSIAKQMNIPLPGSVGSNITCTSLKSNQATISCRKSIIAHHPYATPGAQCVSTSAGAASISAQSMVVATVKGGTNSTQQQQQQQHLNVAQTQAIKVYNHGAALKTIAALMFIICLSTASQS